MACLLCMQSIHVQQPYLCLVRGQKMHWLWIYYIQFALKVMFKGSNVHILGNKKYEFILPHLYNIIIYIHRGVPSLKKILDIRTSNYENILVLKHFY